MSNINTYLNQLILDINEAKNSFVDIESSDDELSSDDEFHKHIESVEEYLHGEPKKISSFTGIKKAQLPPPDQLSKSQKSKVAIELISLLERYHFIPVFPENLPDHIKYKFIYKIWDESHPHTFVGDSYYEFCDYDEENCPFPEYCNSCSEFEVEFNESKEKDFIPGISNYCDRWCERCNFQDKCMNYSFELEMKEKMASEKTESRTLQDSLSHESLSEKETLATGNQQQLYSTHDIELSFNDETEKYELVKDAVYYSELAHNWLMNHNHYFDNHEILWETKGNLQINREALMVVKWFSLFISVKMRRAISVFTDAALFDKDDPDEIEANEYEMNGTAKITLIAIDRSIEAWKTLLGKLPEFKSKIGWFIEILEDLRNKTEDQFPQARSFIRPGFDE